MQLLIADDDLTSRTLLEGLTRLWGYEPIAVEDGEAAWQVLQQDNPPRLLLIDWEMPHLNGLGLCQRIRRSPDSNPAYIILLTARSESVDIVAGLEMGANEYITKPFNSIELQARLLVGKRMLDLQAELNQAKEQLAFQASHDVLTGLLNRRAIMDALNKEVARAQRQKQPLCVGLCDIDFFKRINDSHGHIAGDHILQEVAHLITEELRPFDWVGRYGGEEFLLVLNAAQDDAHKLLNRLRLVIANAAFSFAQQTLNVTISCGVTIYVPPEDDRDILTLIDTADKALYAAKKGGRNRVEFTAVTSQT